MKNRSLKYIKREPHDISPVEELRLDLFTIIRCINRIANLSIDSRIQDFESRI